MKTHKIKDERYWDYHISIAAAFYFIASCANASTKTILGIPENLWGTLSIIWGMMIISNYIFCYKEIFRRSRKIVIRSFTLFCIVYFISAILCTIRGESLHLMLGESALLTFAWWIPVGVCACSVKDKDILYEFFLKSSFIWL